MNDRYQFVRPLFVVVVAFALIGAASMLSSCAAVPKPQTVRQSLIYSDATFTSVVENAIDLRDRGMLTRDQRAQLTQLIDQGNATLKDAHKALGSGDPATVSGKLAIVDTLLDQLRKMIAEAAHE